MLGTLSSIFACETDFQTVMYLFVIFINYIQTVLWEEYEKNPDSLHAYNYTHAWHWSEPLPSFTPRAILILALHMLHSSGRYSLLSSSRLKGCSPFTKGTSFPGNTQWVHQSVLIRNWQKPSSHWEWIATACYYKTLKQMHNNTPYHQPTNMELY